MQSSPESPGMCLWFDNVAQPDSAHLRRIWHVIGCPYEAQQVVSAFDFVKFGSLILACYASILSTINFISDRLSRLTLHVEKRSRGATSATIVRIFALCKSGTVLIPEIEIIGSKADNTAVRIASIPLGVTLRKGDFRVFDQHIDAFLTYTSIWAEVDGYRLQIKSNVVKP